MEGQTEQSLRKGAGGNLAKTGKAGCPLPPAHAEYPHTMPATQSVGTAQTIEVMVKLVSQENRQSGVNAKADLRAPLRDQPIEPPDRRKIERNEQWVRDILGIDDDAAETGLAFAADNRHGATRRDFDRIPTPLCASPLGQRVSIFQCGVDQCHALVRRDAPILQVFPQLQQAQCLGPPLQIKAGSVQSPRAPCMLIKTTGVSGGNPSSSPRLIAMA